MMQPHHANIEALKRRERVPKGIKTAPSLAVLNDMIKMGSWFTVIGEYAKTYVLELGYGKLKDAVLVRAIFLLFCFVPLVGLTSCFIILI